jgi:hypothetical protein
MDNTFKGVFVKQKEDLKVVFYSVVILMQELNDVMVTGFNATTGQSIKNSLNPVSILHCDTSILIL